MSTTSPPTGGRRSPPAVSVDGLTKRYGETVAVDDLSFTVDEGSIVGFLGPNGAGKTTTFRMLVGLAAPTGGEALLMGRRYVDLDDPIRRVGSMLEVSRYHPSRTARQHLAVLSRSAGIPAGRAEELLHLVDLADAADRAVGGYSSGMRQRLGLAAALLGDPEILLLDEPANGLDPQGIRWLREFLRGLAHDDAKTVFVSSHVLAEVAQMVDDVVIIDAGRLVTHGPIETVTEHMGRSVVVRTPDRDRLTQRLTAEDAAVTAIDTDRLTVSGLPIEDVGRMAAQAGIVLFELREERLSLEDTFLSLTQRDEQ